MLEGDIAVIDTLQVPPVSDAAHMCDRLVDGVRCSMDHIWGAVKVDRVIYLKKHQDSFGQDPAEVVLYGKSDVTCCSLNGEVHNF